jgi:proteic killer suppression protein
MPIRSFGDASTAELWQTGHSRAFPGNLLGAMLRKLQMVNAATDIRDLTIPPGNRLKKLEGKRKDDWSIRVNDQWRITFRWSNGQADSVSVEDYH